MNPYTLQIENFNLSYSFITYVIISIFVSVVVSLIFLKYFKKILNSKTDFSESKNEIKNLQSRLDTIAGNVGKINELEELRKNIEELENKITETNKMTNANNLELLKKAIDSELKNVDEKITKITTEKINNEVVIKEEFYELKNRVIDYLGNDENENKILQLFEIIDSDNLKTIQSKCDLLNILKSGYIPELQNDSLRGRISESTINKFLQLLIQKNFVFEENVKKFQINEDEYWIFDFTKNPSQLKSQFEQLKIREKQYQEFIGKNLELIEPGLTIVEREYRLSTGPIDFLCLDKNGLEVGLELKYPKSQSKDSRQLFGYVTEYTKNKNYSSKIRGILVAPEISETVFENLKKYELEGKIIKFNQKNDIVNNDVVIKKTDLQNTNEKSSSNKANPEDLKNIKTRYLELRDQDYPTESILEIIKNEFSHFTFEEIRSILYLN